MCQGLVCHLEIKIISLDVHIVMDIHTHTGSHVQSNDALVSRASRIWLMDEDNGSQTNSLSLPPPPARPPWIRQHLSLALGADSRGEDIWHLFNTISSSVVALLREGGSNYDRRLLKLKATWCQTEAALKEIHEWRFLFGRWSVFSGPFPKRFLAHSRTEIFNKSLKQRNSLS